MIDYRVLRNHLRGMLIDADIFDSTQVAWEGREFDVESKEDGIFFSEICGIDSESSEVTVQNQMETTITYNIYSRKSSLNLIETVEDLRNQIGTLFQNSCGFIVSDVTVIPTEVNRRTATNGDVWRISPIDLTFRLERDK